ncbi:MAG: tetratricopeptide repeat protein [Phycisphaerales bacterium]|nr:tetratricopeptide repeat protein [Phycisphaerales bacterium]
MPVFLTAQAASPEDLAVEAGSGHFPPVILRDPDRDAFGAYHIVAIPSVVVIDPTGVVVYAVAGRLPRFRELLTESLLVATDQEPADQFERSLVGDDEPKPQDRDQQRAERLVHLGEQLLPHHLDDMAEARFREAIALAPGYAPARLGLGELLRTQGHADDAEAQFREVLAKDPTSADAALALARSRFDRGGEGVEEAETLARGVLEKDDMNARAHYQLGRVLESRGDPGAAACYRRAAELLLHRFERGEQ